MDAVSNAEDSCIAPNVQHAQISISIQITKRLLAYVHSIETVRCLCVLYYACVLSNEKESAGRQGKAEKEDG